MKHICFRDENGGKALVKVIDIRSEKDNELFEKLKKRSQLDQAGVMQAVGEIIADVRTVGDKALLEYTKKFDNVLIDKENIRVSGQEIEDALKKIDPKLLEVIRKAKKNIVEFHEKQKCNSWFTDRRDGVILGQLVRPLEVIGIYVPGGTAVLTSSVLMNALPAKVAGVKKIVMATPPGRNGEIAPPVLAAAKEAGVDEIYRMGGAQAIAAMAFGTETVPKVDKIFGPGNIYVATAKRMVYGYCDIDMFAGPSEITVVADASADPRFVAADMLSQAEHDVLSAAVLVTDSPELAGAVVKELAEQAEALPRKDIAKKSLSGYGAVVIVNNIEEAIDVVNAIAPEHLELCVEEPFSKLGLVKNAGAIFLGPYSSEPLGDYFAGPNHVLPTGGTARFFSPLNLDDFMKKSSVISYTREALGKVKDDVVYFAESEGLEGHANAIRIRF